MQFRAALKAVLIVVLLGGMAPVAAMARPPANVDKLESVLLQTLAGGRTGDLLVQFVQQADLSAAYGMDWESRGKYVIEALRGAAAQAQAPAIAYLDRQGLRSRTFLAGNELYVWQASLDAALGLADLADVAQISAATVYPLDPIVTETNSVTATTDWGISDSKADQFWTTFGNQGSGIVVANIDTGVQWNHPGLIGQYKCAGSPGSSACWFDPQNTCGGTPCDNVGHGTHTMGTMVAADDPNLPYIAGMAPDAQWIACKGCANSLCSGYDLSVCADWILAPGGDPNNRPQVVNCSWGGTGGNDWAIPKVQAWRAAGIFPAFAAGNNGPVCRTLYSPADYQESFASAAHSSARLVASYSSRGSSAFGQTPHTKPNISAPGSSICSTVPDSAWSCGYGGTSMASPHTAGAVALLWSCNASLRGQVEETFNLLESSADYPPGDICGEPGEGNCTYGYGFLNVLAAGQAACNAEAPATPSALVATAVSDVEIHLAWYDNAGNELGFKLERSLDQATWGQIAAVGPNTTTYSDTGLAAGTTYYYRVYAFNAVGDSGYSNVASATTATQAPAAPSNLVATAVSDVEIRLSWSDNAGNELGFKLERSLDQATWGQIAAVGPNTTAFSDTGLTGNTTYYYRVYAFNAAGDSGYSNVASAITAPPVPRMHVAGIVLTFQVSRGKYTVSGDVTIKDQNGNAVTGATVSTQWTYPLNKTKAQSAKTSKTGVASFSVSSGAGTYRLCVTNVTKSGWVYAPDQNVITCQERAVP